MYSEALTIADNNTVKLMIDDMREEIAANDNALGSQADEIAAKDNTIASQADEIANLKAELEKAQANK